MKGLRAMFARKRKIENIMTKLKICCIDVTHIIGLQTVAPSVSASRHFIDSEYIRHLVGIGALDGIVDG